MAENELEGYNRLLRRRVRWDRQHILFAATHLLVIALGLWRIGASQGLELPEIMVLTGLIGVVSHFVAVMRSRSRHIIRALMRAALATLACLPAWLTVFWLVALATTHEALLFGIVLAPLLAVLTSGLGIAFQIRPFASRPAAA